MPDGRQPAKMDGKSCFSHPVWTLSSDMTLACDFPIAGLPSGIKREVKPRLQTSFDIRIPPSALPSIQSETAHEELTDLFEWVGLACLGSQRSALANLILDVFNKQLRRLGVKDSSSSYVASYDPPAGSSIGNLTHLSWTGFLSSEFVDSVLREVLFRYV